MSKSTERRWAGRLVALISIAAVSVVTGGTRAAAAPAPVLPPPSGMPSADALPTAQIDGVVWSQAVVGNTVYAGGRFNNARPPGAAPGTQLTPRGNLVAYDITTGQLTSFAPALNGQVLSVAASPDGSRIYVVGDFTTANGQARRRVAAYSTATGQLLSWNPIGVNTQARAVIATSDTVYVGGSFQGAGGTLRSNLAAFRASDGALLNWNPNADLTVWALAVSNDGSAVFAGGQFSNVGGQPNYGLAKINAASGAVMPWNASSTVRNGGNDAGISSLKVSGAFVYGTAWHFGPGGNLEGTFKASAGSGDVEWVTDCHGDVYSSYTNNGVVYAVGHPHYCGNMGGGFPQYAQWRYQHTQAWSDAAGGEILNEVHGYPNWHGIKPGPSMINWLPEMAIGSFTGSYQAGWDVTGNSDYVVVGGEFPRVNGVNQQGLVRFARRSLLTPQQRQQGPRFLNNEIVPTLVPTSPTSVRVSWLAGFDRDDLALQYEVFRAGVAPARYTTVANSNWWTTPSLGFVDAGLTPGQTYTYRIVVRDSDGHVVNGATRNVTMPSSVPTTAHANRVRADGARLYWPLNETGPAAQIPVSDRAGVSDGRSDAGVTWGHPGAIAGDTAARLTTTNEWSRIFSLSTETAPDVFSAQVWIRTTTTTGGRILGFGDLQVLNSGHRDRHIYMNNAGQLIFGVRAQNNSVRTLTSPLAYNNGQWHQVTATMGAGGMGLYVDGALVASRTDTTQGEAYLGYWRVGGDNLSGWPGTPGNVNFVNGYVDEVAIYPTALTQAQVQAQYQARLGGPANQPPTALFTSSTTGLSVSVNGSASSDPDGTIAGYSWNWGDGTPNGSGVTASHPYAAGGTYTVTLTVTDNQGATGTRTMPVTVAAPPANQSPTATFTSSTTGLSVSVNGSASSDPDGTIAGYSWNWGDGTPNGSGVTASHPYATAGTRTVTLTVTDNLGATDSESTQVTVAAAQQVALDTFTRTAANGFGTANIGGTWTVSLPAALSVDGGAGRVSVTPGSGPSAYLNTVSAGNVEATVDIESDKVGTGGGIYQSLIVRRVGTSDYRLKVRITATTVELYLVRIVNGTETTLAAQTVPGLVYQPGVDLHLRLRAIGAGPTSLQGRLWAGAQPEPATWNVTATDATAALQGPGAVGLFTYLSGSATNPPVTIGIDNLDVRVV